MKKFDKVKCWDCYEENKHTMILLFIDETDEYPYKAIAEELLSDYKNGYSVKVYSYKNAELIEEPKDSIVESVISDFKARSEVGIKKYNTTLDREDLTELQWLNHLYEELMDACLYAKKIITNKIK